MEASGLPFGLMEGSGLTSNMAVVNISVTSAVSSIGVTIAHSLVSLMVLFAVTVPAFMVVATVIRNNSLYKYHYWFVANLMACDIITAITVNPLYIALYVAKLFASDSYTVHCGYSLAVLYIAPISTGFMVVNLAIDMALAVTYPFKYMVIMNMRKAIAMVGFAWLLGAVFTLPISASPVLDVEVDDLQLCPTDFTAFLALPIIRLATAIAIIVLNIYLCLVTIKVTVKHRRLVEVAGRNTSTKKSLKKQIKKYKAAVRPCVTLLAIIVCDGILRVVRIVLAVIAINIGFIDNDIFKLIFVLATWMEFIIHPMAYGLMLRKFYHAIFCRNEN